MKEPDIVEQIRAWYGYDAALRPIGEAAIAEITRLRERPGWREHPVFAFLLGSGPLDGQWFGDKHPTEKGAFWWRKHLRAALT
jgi:hypothetical protein